MKTDRFDNMIGSAEFHSAYSVEDFSDYPQIYASVNKSETTESVYVSYYNSDNGERVTVRFSNHMNNATLFGDQLSWDAPIDQILYRLGLATREFFPESKLFINRRQVSIKKLNQYEEASLTIQEMYELGAGADLSEFTGKLAKGSVELILGTSVESFVSKQTNAFGEIVQLGNYVYTVK